MADLPEKQLSRADFPYASDGSVLELMGRTKDWLMAHGHVFMDGEVYGPALIVEEGQDLPKYDTFMHGTGPVRYQANIQLKTLQKRAPQAVGLLGIGESGLYVAYEEPYHLVREAGGMVFRRAHVRYVVAEQEQDEAVTAKSVYDIFVDRAGNVVSLYTDHDEEMIMPSDRQETELKTHENDALGAVVDGLYAATATSRFRRRLNW